ncbi:MAG: proline dehydrogenase family protein, partial [Pseudomonadota bacterium]
MIAFLQKKITVLPKERHLAKTLSIKWITTIRHLKSNALMDIFMSEYGLSNDEGIALMCLAEALLRVPDLETIDALIEDKIAPSNWAIHLGRSNSPLVNASTWALLLTGRVLDEKRPLARTLHSVLKRLGEPVIRNIIKRAMHELSSQFILGRTIIEATQNSTKMLKLGYTYSYDMLGEGAQTSNDALEYMLSYIEAIRHLSTQSTANKMIENPGISIKLSALYERYEWTQKEQVLKHLVPRVLLLAQMAKKSNMALTIDAEESDRLELSMDVIECVLRHQSLHDWDGFGIVVQAYNKRAYFVISWFYMLAKSLQRKVTLRLVKGAYWDSEIKLAQIQGLSGFPVFTSKAATDTSYIQNVKYLKSLTDHIYPQFATHNAHTIAMVKTIFGDFKGYEFQRLHGMGDTLYQTVRQTYDIKCRIYAPVGVHEDLLAYLV